MRQITKKVGLLLFPIIILLGMTNCSQFQSFSETDGARFLSENPIFRSTTGHDPHDENTNPIVCVPGYQLNTDQTACVLIPITCPAGQTPNNDRTACIPIPITCNPGYRPNADRSACVPIPITCPAGQRPNNDRTACIPIPITCNPGYRPNADRSACVPIPITCPAGQRPNNDRTACIPIPIECPAGQRLNAAGTACIRITCPSGYRLNSDQTACTPIPITCNPGYRPNADRSACVPIPITCPAGQRPNADRTACVPIPIECPAGQRLNAAGTACVLPPTCNPGYKLNAAKTACIRITCPSGYRLNSAKTGCEPIPTRPTNTGGDGGDGGDGGGCPLMIDSEGVEHADLNELRNSDDSYFKSGELSLTAPADGVKFNLLGQQTRTELDNGEFLHIKPKAHNFKFQISWTDSNQSRYRWLTLPDANGHVNGIDELFGDNTFGPNQGSPFARDGFRALMKWDRGDTTNSSQDFSDGYIDANDAVFSKLRLWHDLNGDGNCNTESEIANELVTLDQVGITYIHLMANENFFETDSHGNDITYKSLVGFRASEEGVTRFGTAFDIWFRYDPKEVISTGYAEIKSNL